MGLPGTHFPVFLLGFNGFGTSWEVLNQYWNGEGVVPPEPERDVVGRDDIYIDV